MRLILLLCGVETLGMTGLVLFARCCLIFRHFEGNTEAGWIDGGFCLGTYVGESPYL